jgi:hypothetical protein
MPHSHDSSTATMERRTAEHRPSLGGVPVREQDIEETRSIRLIALLFRGMALLLLVLMFAQVVFGLTSTVPLSPGVLFADAVRLVIFAGLLWGAGELAVLWVKSHYDIRAQRILTARIAHLLQQEVDERQHGDT